MGSRLPRQQWSHWQPSLPPCLPPSLLHSLLTSPPSLCPCLGGGRCRPLTGMLCGGTVVFDQAYPLSSTDWRHQVENTEANSQSGSAESLTLLIGRLRGFIGKFIQFSWIPNHLDFICWIHWTMSPLAWKVVGQNVRVWSSRLLRIRSQEAADWGFLLT